MHYSIRHLTKFLYKSPVSESIMETRMHPRSDQNQRCLTFHLSVSPRSRHFKFSDHLGNHVHHFDIPVQHEQLVIVAESLVEMQPALDVPGALPPGSWEELDRLVQESDFWEMMLPSEFATSTPALEALGDHFDLRRRNDPLSVLHKLNKDLYDYFDYKPKSTKADSPIDVALSTKAGVCQDFAHIMITLVRSRLKIPCRYVSGYLYHAPKDKDRSESAATHAWVECFLPELGWMGFDPTNWLVVTASGSVTGARTDQTAVTVDGMDVNDIATGQFGATVANIPIDATQEFRGTVAGLPSNLGTGSGGQFQLVTKSGTNRFHGNINEYHRDTSTVGNTWFNNNAGVPRTPLIQNQFGGNVGGPVLHDKLFFFADFYNSRIIQSLSGADVVPLDSYRAGNIGYIKNTAGCSTSSSRQNTTPACIGFYTPAQVKALDPAGIGENATLMSVFNSRYPHANDLTGGDGVNTGLLRFTMPAPNIEYDGVARIDYNLTAKQRVFLQFHAAHRDSIQSINYFPGDPVTRPFQDRSYGYVGSHIWQIGGNKVNQFYYGETVSVLSFPLAYNPNGATIVSLNSPLINPYDGNNIQKRRIPIPEVRDDFNWQIGSHNIGLGGTYKFIKTENFLGSDYNTYTIGLGGNVTGLNTALRPADIANSSTTNLQWDQQFTQALGRVGQISSIYNYTNAGTVLPSASGANRRYRYYQTEIYLGDTWKVNKQLTVSYGVRYQNYTVPYETLGSEAVPSIAFGPYFAARVAQSKAGITGNAALPLVSYSLGGPVNNATGYYKPNNLDFAPRLAFAYNPSYSPKTVINGSAGVVYDRTVYNAISFQQNQATFIFQNSVAQLYGTSTNAAGSLAADPRIGSTLTALPAAPVAPALSKPYTPFVSSTGTPTGNANGNTATGFDYNLPTPYSISVNAGMQQELPGRFIMRLNYAGRFGRRLLAQADAAQVIEFPDQASGQTMSQAFAALTSQLRITGFNPLNATAQPWFEHLVTPGYGTAHGYANNTAVVAYNFTTNARLGSIPAVLRSLLQNNLIPTNLGMASQFARDIYYTSKGSSNYNGLLFSLSKNLSQGVKFDFNYTMSHSIDNVSLIANSNGLYLYDATNNRAGRANSDFDVQNIITSDFIVQLPFGQGRAYANHTNRLVDTIIGGWSVSGLPSYQSGLAFSPASGASLAGVSTSDPAIFTGASGDLAAHVHKDPVTGQLQLYTNGTATNTEFRGPLGIEYGQRNSLRGPSAFIMNAGLDKNFIVLPDNKLNLRFRADFFNVLNHPTFSTPSASLAATSTFGVISSTSNNPRVGQFSLRLEF